MAVRKTAPELREYLYQLICQDQNPHAPLVDFTVSTQNRQTIVLEGPLRQRFFLVIMDESDR